MDKAYFPLNVEAKKGNRAGRSLESMMAALSPDFGSHALVPAVLLLVLGTASTSSTHLCEPINFFITLAGLVNFCLMQPMGALWIHSGNTK